MPDPNINLADLTPLVRELTHQSAIIAQYERFMEQLFFMLSGYPDRKAIRCDLPLSDEIYKKLHTILKENERKKSADVAE